MRRRTRLLHAGRPAPEQPPSLHPPLHSRLVGRRPAARHWAARAWAPCVPPRRRPPWRRRPWTRAAGLLALPPRPWRASAPWAARRRPRPAGAGGGEEVAGHRGSGGATCAPPGRPRASGAPHLAQNGHGAPRRLRAAPVKPLPAGAGCVVRGRPQVSSFAAQLKSGGLRGGLRPRLHWAQCAGGCSGQQPSAATLCPDGPGTIQARVSYRRPLPASPPRCSAAPQPPGWPAAPAGDPGDEGWPARRRSSSQVRRRRGRACRRRPCRRRRQSTACSLHSAAKGPWLPPRHLPSAPPAPQTFPAGCPQASTPTSRRRRRPTCSPPWAPWAPAVSLPCCLHTCPAAGRWLAAASKSRDSSIGWSLPGLERRRLLAALQCVDRARPLLLPATSPRAALGAVFIAAVGVWGVFKMAFYVASETGRSINADKTSGEGSGSEGGGGGGIQAASPLERPLWQQRQQRQQRPGARPLLRQWRGAHADCRLSAVYAACLLKSHWLHPCRRCATQLCGSGSLERAERLSGMWCALLRQLGSRQRLVGPGDQTLKTLHLAAAQARRVVPEALCVHRPAPLVGSFATACNTAASTIRAGGAAAGSRSTRRRRRRPPPAAAATSNVHCPCRRAFRPCPTPGSVLGTEMEAQGRALGALLPAGPWCQHPQTALPGGDRPPSHCRCRSVPSFVLSSHAGRRLCEPGQQRQGWVALPSPRSQAPKRRGGPGASGLLSGRPGAPLPAPPPADLLYGSAKAGKYQYDKVLNVSSKTADGVVRPGARAGRQAAGRR